MRRRTRRAAALASALVVLAGCAAPSDEPAPDRRVDAALVAQREAAGIEDCPVTPAEAVPAADGLPDLLLGCLGSGRQVNLAGLRGRPMVVNVWAQWCAPCRDEAPFLAEFASRADERVQVLGIDYADPDPGLALAFAEQAGWTWPHVTDPMRQSAGPLGFGGIPVTLLVDADGRVVHRHVGPITSTHQLVDAVGTHLGVVV